MTSWLLYRDGRAEVTTSHYDGTTWTEPVIVPVEWALALTAEHRPPAPFAEAVLTG